MNSGGTVDVDVDVLVLESSISTGSNHSTEVNVVSYSAPQQNCCKQVGSKAFNTLEMLPLLY